eukprot:EG_transcript_12665
MAPPATPAPGPRPPAQPTGLGPLMGRPAGVRTAALLWLPILLLSHRCFAVPIGRCDSATLAPFPVLHCEHRCPSPRQHLWAPVTTKRATLHYTARLKGRVVVNSTAACGNHSEAVPYAFLLEDFPSLGHMQMSVVSLFSFLLTLPAGVSVTVVWQLRAEELAPVKTQYYRPLLAHLSAFFHAERRLVIRDLDAEELQSRRVCLLGAVIGMRTCVLPDIPYGGHCGAWFTGPPAVAAFRHFLRRQLNLSLAADGCCHGAHRSWRALLFDRAPGHFRSLQSPRRVRQRVAAFFARPGAPPVHLDYYRHPAKREEASPFEDNCAQWSRYDLIIAVHGAALSNLICARPCATVVEVGFETPLLTMYTSLAAQLQLHHCFVPVAPGASWYGPVMPGGHLTECLQQFVDLHR